MPLLDFENCALDALASAEICVVGAGAAGIFLSRELARRGRRVLLLETGHLALDDERQALNEIAWSGQELSAAVWGRKRVVGGTTLAWGGQSLPFSPLDFEARPWVRHSGWPLTFADVAPHYAPANAFMGIDAYDYDQALGRLLHRPDPGFDAANVRYHFSKWSPQPNFQTLLRRENPARVTTVANAHVIALHPGPDGAVEAVEVASWQGRRARLPVRTLVLAQGGIETCRQLLIAAQRHPGRFGDASGWLGRAFMEHPCVDAGTLTHPDPPSPHRYFGLRVRRGRKYSVRLSTSAAWQAAHRSLNASVTFFPHYPAAQGSPVDDLRRLLAKPGPRTALAALAAAPALARTAAVLLRHGFVYKPGSTLHLAVMAEQSPDPANRLTLTDAADRFGQPHVHLHWRPGEDSWRTVHAFVHAVRAEIHRLGLGDVVLRAELSGPEPAPLTAGLLSDVNHHMGGARMSARPEDGVVDRDLKVWGQPRMHVCSTAVFPTGSHSNPTLTLLALAHRLAGQLAG